MAANLLRCEKAVQMSVFVVRAFEKMREHLNSLGKSGIQSNSWADRGHVSIFCK